MVLTSRTQTLLFDSNADATSGGLVRLPLSIVPLYERRCPATGAIVRAANKSLKRANLWSSEEHERFLHGLELFPNGPWKEVAKIVGTKSTRQTMTHAQKYRQKIERHMQGKGMSAKAKQSRLHRPKSVEATAVVTSPDVTPSHVDGLLSCSALDADAVTQAVASPTEVYLDEFDTSFLDLEFDALLASFGSSAPAQHQQSWEPCVWRI